MQKGIAIPLKYQHNHIEDSVLFYSSQECCVYLVADGEEDELSFVKLKFDGVKCVRSARTDCSPAMGIYPADPSASFIVELTESNWSIEAHKAYTYAGTPLRRTRRHYVVSNHDVFHEVLADSFSETLVEPESVEYECVKRHFN